MCAIFTIFLEEISYAHQGCIYLIKIQQTVKLWNIITIQNTFLFKKLFNIY